MPAFYNPPMTQAFDVVVRGAGPVGQALALLLAQAKLRVGHDAGVARPSGSADVRADARADVRAYALNAASRAVLESLRAWPEPSEGVNPCTPVRQMQVWGDTGAALNFSADALGCDALAWIVDAAALHASLAQALRYQSLVEPAPEAASAALFVACEGRASASRSSHAINFEAMQYPQHAIAARLRCQQQHAGRARQWFVNGEAGPEVLALLPMAGSAQEDGLALVWSVPQARAAQLMAMEPGAFEAALRASAAQSALPPEADPGPLQLASERQSWPLALATADRWVDPGFALVGDAAHTVHPLAGQGLNLGLADAAELARVLREREYWRSVGDVRLLRRYERARKAQVAQVGFATDSLERLFAHPDARVQQLRNWGLQAFGRSGPLRDWVARQAMGV